MLQHKMAPQPPISSGKHMYMLQPCFGGLWACKLLSPLVGSGQGHRKGPTGLGVASLVTPDVGPSMGNSSAAPLCLHTHLQQPLPGPQDFGSLMTSNSSPVRMDVVLKPEALWAVSSHYVWPVVIPKSPAHWTLQAIHGHHGHDPWGSLFTSLRHQELPKMVITTHRSKPILAARWHFPEPSQAWCRSWSCTLKAVACWRAGQMWLRSRNLVIKGNEQNMYIFIYINTPTQLSLTLTHTFPF